MSTAPRSTAARSAAIHVLLTFAVGFVLLTVGLNTDGTTSDVFMAAAPIAAVVGTIAAMVRTALAWRADTGWQVWQGASWFLLIISLMWVLTALPAIM